MALLALSAGSTPAAGDGPPGRLDSQLSQVARAFRERGHQEAKEVAAGLGVAVESGFVRAIVEANAGMAEEAEVNAERLGVVPEGRYQDLVQVRAPLQSLEDLARAGGVRLVRVPLRAAPLVTGEGVALTNADDWHLQGMTGAGAKVAVLDLGFDGYESRLGTELPATVTAMSFRADGDIHGAGQPHGTGVAEIVHEMAPGAAMYLANFDTEVELANAVAWLTSQDVDVVNASWGYFTSGPGDGTGIVDDVVTQSVASGAMWAVAAGNHAQKHWSGQFNDTDGDHFHEFQNTPFEDEGNQLGFFLFADELAIGELKWDDPFGSACRDYDLYLKRTDDNGLPVTVASSQNRQYNGGCVPLANPVEMIFTTVPVTDTYHLVIQKHVAPTNANMHLYSAVQDLEYYVTENSVLQPADNSNVTTVGAVPYYAPDSIEYFSSLGPTSDGRIKPDIVAPDGVSNATFGSFFGTSAAAPHIAGAAALISGRLPCYGPAQLGTLLESHVVDLGVAGKDDTYGSGRLSLAAPPADLDSDALGDACDPDDDNDLVPDADETACGSDPLDITPPLSRPERLDGPFAAVDDDGDTQVDEALPAGADQFDCDRDGFIGGTEREVFSAPDTRPDQACVDAWPADFDNDGSVTGFDLSAIAGVIGHSVPPVPVRRDIGPDPPDGAITGADLSAVAGRIGTSCTP